MSTITYLLRLNFALYKNSVSKLRIKLIYNGIKGNFYQKLKEVNFSKSLNGILRLFLP